MKIKVFANVIALSALGLAFFAQAHDPKEHMKDAEKPDCTTMKNMDHSKMDMNDPVMQAMMKKCMKDMDHGNPDKDESQDIHQSDQQSSDDQHTEHQH